MEVKNLKFAIYADALEDCGPAIMTPDVCLNVTVRNFIRNKGKEIRQVRNILKA